MPVADAASAPVAPSTTQPAGQLQWQRIYDPHHYWLTYDEAMRLSTTSRYWSGCEAIGWCFLNRAEANRIVRRAPQRGTGDVRLFRMTVGFKWVQVVV